ncbi:MAG: 50S ribosome-binding GTPase [Hyphomicrobiaceae bacterium]|nr:50S ribosome-binding GTPase [Hyphomicrobiaceae bacterium]
MSTPRPRRAAVGYLRGIMVVLALVLPTLSLAVLGTVWLWQNNLLLVWSISASIAAVAIFALESWLVGRGARRLTSEPDAAETAEARSNDGAPAHYSPSEREAWAAVEKLAQAIDPATLNSREAIMALGTTTVESVAARMHPGDGDPLWKFTVPEALTLVGRVSSELNRFVVASVPLGDRLTVGQLLAIYRWRGMVGVAEKAYDLWRLLRFANPAAAISGELRERLSRTLVDGMRTELSRRLAQAYVREVGRAAIDLYSGRLRPDIADAAMVDATAPGAAPSGPLRFAVVGQSGVGKSSLINALAGEVAAPVNVVPSDGAATVHRIAREGTPGLDLIDTPSLNTEPERQAELRAELERADAIVWVLSAGRPDRSADAAFLASLRAAWAADPRRHVPPIVFVLSGIDRLRPFKVWEPPYDVAQPTTEKGRSIRDAIDATAEDLSILAEDIVPVMTAQPADAYNLDVVWAELAERLPAATNARLNRLVADASTGGVRWGRLLSQTIGAARAAGRTVWRGRAS